MVKHCCCAFNYTNSTQKQKMLKNIKYWQMLDFSIPSGQRKCISIMLRECQNESGVRDGLQPVARCYEAHQNVFH